MRQQLKVLSALNDDGQADLIRSVLATSTTPRFRVDYAPHGCDPTRYGADDDYAALLLDFDLNDISGETLHRQLNTVGVSAPALVLTTPDWDGVPGGADDYLPKAEGLVGTALVRAIVAMVARHELSQELVAARDEARQATTLVNQLAHDLATPLGVIMGMTQVLLADGSLLDDEGRECLEDVSREALRACAILKRLNPIVTAVSADTHPAIQAPSLPPATVTGPGSRIVLIADDDPATRRLVSITLASDQYTVLNAADGEEAWRLIREHHPAVAILDWQMPVYSGLELTDVIKGDPQVRDMTVIMLTGRSDMADREAGAQARADLYLVKPFVPQELLSAVEQALGIHQP